MGIPRSQLKTVATTADEGDLVEGGLQMPDGSIARMTPDEARFDKHQVLTLPLPLPLPLPLTTHRSPLTFHPNPNPNPNTRLVRTLALTPTLSLSLTLILTLILTLTLTTDPDPTDLNPNQAKHQAQLDAEQVPEELRCPVTKRLFRDAVLLPCCGVSVSDDAIGQARFNVPRTTYHLPLTTYD